MATQTGSTYISDSVTDVVEIPTWIFDHIEIEQSVPIQAILSVIGNRNSKPEVLSSPKL